MQGTDIAKRRIIAIVTVTVTFDRKVCDVHVTSPPTIVVHQQPFFL